MSADVLKNTPVSDWPSIPREQRLQVYADLLAGSAQEYGEALGLSVEAGVIGVEFRQGDPISFGWGVELVELDDKGTLTTKDITIFVVRKMVEHASALCIQHLGQRLGVQLPTVVRRTGGTARRGAAAGRERSQAKVARGRRMPKR